MCLCWCAQAQHSGRTCEVVGCCKLSVGWGGRAVSGRTASVGATRTYVIMHVAGTVHACLAADRHALCAALPLPHMLFYIV